MPEYTSQQAEAIAMCNQMGFDNVSQYTSKMSNTETTVPYESPKPTAQAAVESSNTMLTPVDPSAHDLVVRSR